MQRTSMMALICFMLATAGAQAQSQKQVGNWFISTDKDRFSGDPVIIAMTPQNGAVLAVRCMQRTLSFAVKEFTFPIEHGTLFKIAFKGGQHKIAITAGDAVTESLIEVVVTEEIRNALLTSDEYAFRFATDGGQFDLVFKDGTAARALPALLQACPANNPAKSTE